MSGKIEPVISPELLEDEELEDDELEDEELLELEDVLLELDEALLLVDELELLEPVTGVLEPPQADNTTDTEATASQRGQPGIVIHENTLINFLRRL